MVDDGSSDNIAEVVGEFAGVRFVRLEHAGLSVARNRGAEVARGEIVAYTDDDCEPDAGWLRWLACAFVRGGWDACGGPNLPPLPDGAGGAGGASGVDEAVVASAPGAPSHVLSGDVVAEHLPGCNLAVRREVLLAVGGFREDYRVAGDDVEAEALLMRDHPGRFRRGGGAVWNGHVYGGGAMVCGSGSVIYHGAMGTAPYQQLVLGMQPQRPLPGEFDCAEARAKLFFAKLIQPKLRAWARWRHSLRWRGRVEKAGRKRDYILVDSMRQYDECEARWWAEGGIGRERVLGALAEDGWTALENDSDWDFERRGLRLLVACEPHRSGTVVLTRMEMDSRQKGRMPADFVSRLEGLGLGRV